MVPEKWGLSPEQPAGWDGIGVKLGYNGKVEMRTGIIPKNEMPVIKMFGGTYGEIEYSHQNVPGSRKVQYLFSR
jgi:hypothetical protein